MAVGQERDFTRYLAYTRYELLTVLGKVMMELKGLTQDYYMMKADEVRAQVTAYRYDQSGSVTGRQQAAKVEASEITASIMTVKSDLDQLSFERDYILILLKEWFDGPEKVSSGNYAESRS